MELKLVSGTAYGKPRGQFIIALYHHADRAKKGLKNPLVDPRMFTYYPAYNLGISRKLFSQEFPCDSHRSWYRDRETTFSIYIFTWYFDIYFEKKGTNWCSWRFLKRQVLLYTYLKYISGTIRMVYLVYIYFWVWIGWVACNFLLSGFGETNILLHIILLYYPLCSEI